MRIKALKFPDGKIAITSGLLVEVNKNKPILEEEIGGMNEKEIGKLMEKPHKFKFSKKAKKIKHD